MAGLLRPKTLTLVDSSDNEIGVAANPLRVDPTGTTTQPVSITGLDGGLVNVDAFGRLVTSTPHTLSDIINKYGLDTRKWGTSLLSGGTVTHLPNESALRVAVTSSSGSTAKLRTNLYYHYQAGKAQNILITGYHSDLGQTNQIREWGYFDDNNGVFFRLSGTILSLVRRTFVSGGVVEEVVPQSLWNTDTLIVGNPLNASGMNLDLTKGNIYGVNLQWLGVGTVICSVSNVVVHIFRNPNTIIGPYMSTAQLPISVNVTNSAASSIGSFTTICTTVESFAGRAVEGETFGTFNDSDVTVGNTEIPLLAIRLSQLYNGIENRMQVIPTIVEGETQSGRASMRIILNPTTLTGGTFTSVSPRSGVEYNATATSFTGGQHLVRLLLPNAQDVASFLNLRQIFEADANRLHNYAFGGGDVLLITGQLQISTGGSTKMRASIAWEEIK